MDTDQNYLDLLHPNVVDHVSALLAYWDKDTICRYANAAYLDWFGKSREEMLNNITIKELLGDLYELNLPYITEALRGNTQNFERDIPTQSGGVRHSFASYYPDIENGEVKGFFVHVADVTTAKILEKKLISINEIISQQNERLLNFSNIVSHNLKSYANNLSSILDLYTLADTEAEKEQMIDYLKKISKGFSSSITDLNKIVMLQNENTLPLEQLTLHPYIEKALLLLQIEIKHHSAIIENNVSKEVTLLANPAYLESILLNLVTNALKYRSQTRIPFIEINSKFIGNQITLSIKDNGAGIDLKKHGSSLFGMYKTFHGNADAQGIGLFISKYQIEKMGGQIIVESEEYIGTTFTVFFQAA